MRDRRTDSIAIITGATGGIGGQCTRLMAEAGWNALLLCDLDEARLDSVAAPLRQQGVLVETFAGSMTDPLYPAHLVTTLRSREVGALIHAAGVSPAQVPQADLIFEINLDASLRLLAHVRTRMAEHSAAVLFASIAGHLPVSPEAEAAFAGPIPEAGSHSLRHWASDEIEAYLLSKRAIIAFVKREAKSLYAERKARIVSVSPGMIDTPMTHGVVTELTSALISGAAIPRLGLPEEVAKACVFLCSSDASFITGCDLLIDGGELPALRL